MAPRRSRRPWSGTSTSRTSSTSSTRPTARFHVDLDRVYLVGHGTPAGRAPWWFGGAPPDLFASVGASAASSAPQCSGLPDGAQGPRCSSITRRRRPRDAGRSHHARRRRAARGRVRTSCTSSSTGLGHGFPGEAVLEMFDAIRGKRLADARTHDDHPRSSFARPDGADGRGEGARRPRRDGVPLSRATGDVSLRSTSRDHWGAGARALQSPDHGSGLGRASAPRTIPDAPPPIA